MLHIPTTLTIICTSIVSQSYLWHRPGPQTLMTINPNLSDLSPCLPDRCLKLSTPSSLQRFLVFSRSTYLDFASDEAILPIVWDALLTSCRFSSSWSQCELLQLFQDLSNLVLPHPLLSASWHPTWATCTASHLAPASSFCTIVCPWDFCQRDIKKKSRLAFSTETFYWYWL